MASDPFDVEVPIEPITPVLEGANDRALRYCAVVPGPDDAGEPEFRVEVTALRGKGLDVKTLDETVRGLKAGFKIIDQPDGATSRIPDAGEAESEIPDEFDDEDTVLVFEVGVLDCEKLEDGSVIAAVIDPALNPDKSHRYRLINGSCVRCSHFRVKVERGPAGSRVEVRGGGDTASGALGRWTSPPLNGREMKVTARGSGVVNYSIRGAFVRD